MTTNRRRDKPAEELMDLPSEESLIDGDYSEAEGSDVEMDDDEESEESEEKPKKK